MFQTILNVALILAVVALFREVRSLNKIIDARGNNPPAPGEEETPQLTPREQARAAVRDHEDKFHRRN